MKQGVAIIGLMIVTLIWGGGFVASDLALDSLLPFQIMAVRFGLATLFMGVISLPALKSISKDELKAGSLMGISLFLGFAFQTVGLQYTTPSKSAFLTALYVVIVPFIAFVFLRKRVGRKGIIGAILSILGVALLSLNADLSFGFGDVLTILCAISFAFQIFFTGLFSQTCRVSVLNFLQMAASFLMSLCGMVLFGETSFQFERTGVFSILYLAVLSTMVCYLLQTACQKYIDETKSAIILSMESVFGTLFSILILHEYLTFRMLVGCAVILAAVVISNLPEAETKQSAESV